ncbi:hypothetical protein [Massilia luteola]|nr:hypothetical protein [Massilia sp. Gc5]
MFKKGARLSGAPPPRAVAAGAGTQARAVTDALRAAVVAPALV